MYGVLYGSAGLGLDTGTRAYILVLYTDLFPTLICPAAIFYGAPTIRCQPILLPFIVQGKGELKDFFERRKSLKMDGLFFHEYV